MGANCPKINELSGRCSGKLCDPGKTCEDNIVVRTHFRSRKCKHFELILKGVFFLLASVISERFIFKVCDLLLRAKQF